MPKYLTTQIAHLDALLLTYLEFPLLMLDSLWEVWSINPVLQLALLGLIGILAFLGSLSIPQVLQSMFSNFISPKVTEAYQKVVEPYEGLLWVVSSLFVADIILLLIFNNGELSLIEIPLGLTLAITGSWFGNRLFKQFFDVYLLDAAIKSGRKLNSELLILSKLIANSIIVVLAIIVFAQTHQINILGLVASLGVGGLAVAFAAQKTLEQLLGGIVIYLDRPFVVDDYIGLPDGTFGRVESIGLRSTKIRNSGKGTLVVVPNSSLTQVSIENFTGAKKVIALMYLNFYQAISSEDQAFVKQVIMESSTDIFGIDTQSTEVTFRELLGKNELVKTQAQITFFILGSGEVSMDLRRQLLYLASQNINQKLQKHGIEFTIEEPTIYVDSPITI
ncbi:mechanosensitive ion channel domain-containing protein [Microcoleus sp. FACHB-SPT15]|uniref:mechanosensitive ion channel family protein n=1 Tax=Microcoleus sp. FACHB-SPT15 TaxID=2692830 RepID=UPI0028C416D3|nr:mechanosensitive ion channel domain-containing protein [Microcoleus sp. FACHB-SPT15]